jgi:hypothetical protein
VFGSMLTADESLLEFKKARNGRRVNICSLAVLPQLRFRRLAVFVLHI